MKKAELKEIIKEAVREHEWINLYDTSIFYYMGGYAPRVTIKSLTDAILEIRKEIREEQI